MRCSFTNPEHEMEEPNTKCLANMSERGRRVDIAQAKASVYPNHAHHPRVPPAQPIQVPHAPTDVPTHALHPCIPGSSPRLNVQLCSEMQLRLPKGTSTEPSAN
eukprot:scpid97636/ scgid29221/ 